MRLEIGSKRRLYVKKAGASEGRRPFSCYRVK